MSVTHVAYHIFRSAQKSSYRPRQKFYQWHLANTVRRSTPSSLYGERSRNIILGIESSCDDTGAAIVDSSGQILGEALAHQDEIHALWGGVVPKLAADAHSEVIDSVIDEALDSAGIKPEQLTAVAVTIGPGLSLCLRVGVTKARHIAKKYRLPLVDIHHMEAHALVARLCSRQANCEIEFPFLTLLVSGGHNLLLVSHDVGRYTQLGTTLDDALGEAFDKTARTLGLLGTGQNGGGAALEALAKKGLSRTILMRGKIYTVFCSHRIDTIKKISTTGEYYSIQEMQEERERLGLQTAKEESRSPGQLEADIAASFQQVAIMHLIERTERAVQWAKEVEDRPINSLVISGGVAANSRVREAMSHLARRNNLQLAIPTPNLCTDNGVMVAWAGIENYTLGRFRDPPPVDESDDFRVELKPRWPLTGVAHHNATTESRSFSKKFSPPLSEVNS